MEEPLSAPEPRARRLPEVPWKPVEAIPVALLVFAVAGIATVALAGLTRAEATGVLLGALTFEVALAAGCLLWARLLHKAPASSLGLTSAALGRRVAVGFGSGLLLFGVTVLVVAPALYTLLSLLTGQTVVPPEQPVLPADPTQAQIAIAGLAVLIAAPFGEEIFFRGFMYSALRRRIGFWGAAIISSVVFAAFHVIPLLMPLMFFVGLGMAYLYERWGSLAVPIAAHAAFNSVGFTFIVLRLLG